ncbi:MAG: phosphopantetheine-binding protein [Reichenbachiella sp.]
MTREEVVKTINGFLEEEFEVEVASLDPNGALQDTLELDSLDYVDLVVVIESNFGFKVTGEDFKTIVTLNDFYDFLTKKVQQSA